MFYLFNFEPDPTDMEARGSDTECVPLLCNGLWLVSSINGLDLTGLTPVMTFETAEEFIAWRDIQEAGE